MYEAKYNYSFETTRLEIKTYDFSKNTSKEVNELTLILPSMLTNSVTRFLPDHWHNLASQKDVEDWLDDRLNEGLLLTIHRKTDEEIIGLLILGEFSGKHAQESLVLHLGFLFSESVWGQGYASELIQGLIQLCKQLENVKAVIGGVNRGNFASIALLKKNGFVQQQDSTEIDDTIFFRIIV